MRQSVRALYKKTILPFWVAALSLTMSVLNAVGTFDTGASIPDRLRSLGPWIGKALDHMGSSRGLALQIAVFLCALVWIYARAVRRPERSVVAKQLAELAEWAVHSLQNAQQPQGEENTLAARFHTWQRTVLLALDESGWVTETQKSHFRVLGTWNNRQLPGMSLRYAELREEIAERIARLREIASDIETEAK
jgi:hypothetical protein